MEERKRPYYDPKTAQRQAPQISATSSLSKDQARALAETFANCAESVCQRNGIPAAICDGKIIQGKRFIAYLSVASSDDREMVNLLGAIRLALITALNMYNISVYYADVDGRRAFMLDVL